MEGKRKVPVFNRTTTNICKGIAIILMYIHHSFYDADAMMNVTVKTFLLSQDQLMAFAKLCKVCVSIFVFLTAFGVYRSTKEHPYSLSEKSYSVVWKRFVNLWGRFFTVYVLAVLTSHLTGMGYLGSYRGEGPIKTVWYMVTDAAGFANAFKGVTLNPTWWYMPFAYFLIFAVPVLVALVDRIGAAFVLIMLFLPSMGGFDTDHAFWRYGMAIALGLVFAKYHVPERIEEFCRKKNPGWLYRGLGAVLCLILSVGCLICRQDLGRPWIWEGISAAIICVLVFLILNRVPVVSPILALIGKYSMYMFLIHTFIRSYNSRLHAFSYLPQHPVLIVLLLLADTLVISIIVDKIFLMVSGTIKKILKK